MEPSIAEVNVKLYHRSLQLFLNGAVQEEQDKAEGGNTKAAQWARDKCREWYDQHPSKEKDTINTSVHCLIYASIRDAYEGIESFVEHFHRILDWGFQKWFTWDEKSHQHVLTDESGWNQLFPSALAFKHCLVSHQGKRRSQPITCVEMTLEETEEKKKTACHRWQRICCYVGCGSSVTWNKTHRWDTFKYCETHLHFLFVRLIRHVQDVDHRPEVSGSGLFDLYLNVYAFPIGTTFDNEHICQSGSGAIQLGSQDHVPSHIGPIVPRLTRYRLSDKPCQRYGKHPRKDAASSLVTRSPVSQFEYLRSNSGSSVDERGEGDPTIDTAPRIQLTKKKGGKKHMASSRRSVTSNGQWYTGRGVHERLKQEVLPTQEEDKKARRMLNGQKSTEEHKRAQEEYNRMMKGAKDESGNEEPDGTKAEYQTAKEAEEQEWIERKTGEKYVTNTEAYEELMVLIERKRNAIIEQHKLDEQNDDRLIKETYENEKEHMGYIAILSAKEAEMSVQEAEISKIDTTRQGDEEHSQKLMQILQTAKYTLAVAQENNKKGLQACRQKLQLLEELAYQRDRRMLLQIQKLNQFENKRLERETQLNDISNIQLKHKSEALAEDNIQLKHKSESFNGIASIASTVRGGGGGAAHAAHKGHKGSCVTNRTTKMADSIIKPTLGLHETGIVVWNNKPMDDIRGQLHFTSQAVLKLSAGHMDEPCRLTQVADPIDDSDAISKRYLDSVVGTINPTTLLSPCRVATTTELWSISNTLRPGYYIDGVRLLDGDRVLVKNQHTTLDNGVYTVDTNGPFRSTDAGVGVLLRGLYCCVKDGEQHANQSFICVSEGEFGSHSVLFRPLSISNDAPTAVSVIQPKLQSLGGITTTVMQDVFCDTLHVNKIKGVEFSETPTSIVNVEYVKQTLRSHTAIKPPVNAVTTRSVCVHDMRLYPQRPVTMVIDGISMDETIVDQLTHALGIPLPSADGGSTEHIHLRTAAGRDAVTTVRIVQDLGQPMVLQGLKMAVRTPPSYSNDEYTCTLSVYGINSFDSTDESDVCIAKLRGIQHLTSLSATENLHQGIL